MGNSGRKGRSITRQEGEVMENVMAQPERLSGWVGMARGVCKKKSLGSIRKATRKKRKIGRRMLSP